LEKQRGLSVKSAKLDRGLISKKHRGFFAKWRGISTGVYFSTDKAVDRVHASVDRPGTLDPPWTDGLRATHGEDGLGWRRMFLGGGAMNVVSISESVQT
jgi:hypothetical protein